MLAGAASIPCPQHVVTYGAWLLLDGISCEDPIVEEAAMPLPHPDVGVVISVADRMHAAHQGSGRKHTLPGGLGWPRPRMVMVAQVGAGWGGARLCL